MPANIMLKFAQGVRLERKLTFQQDNPNYPAVASQKMYNGKGKIDHFYISKYISNIELCFYMCIAERENPQLTLL